MCGFLGKISFNDIQSEDLFEANKYLECRGPDSKCNYEINNQEINFNLIFNRLSILDLSSNANQPMISKKYNSVLMFNGEIYNHKKLREELMSSGCEFNTSHSDSEVVLNGLSMHGKDFINKLDGQFAIFFVDLNKKKILLTRDRLGQKPLYYFLSKEDLIFSSNLISVIKTAKEYKFSNQEIFNYINYGVINTPNTLFKNYKKLKPAEIIEINFEKNKFDTKTTIYWKPEDFLDENEFDYEEFFELFSLAVSKRMTADVPIANFLSGGLDSTAIVKNLNDRKIKTNTFSVHLENKNYDESFWSNIVSNKYKTNHKSVLISSNINNSDIFSSLDSLDEPYDDVSVVPSYLLSKEISKYYKVAISGDGGDELLGGYKRTHLTMKDKNFFDQLISKTYNFYPGIFGTGTNFKSRNKDIKISYKSFLEDVKLLNLLGIEAGSYDFTKYLDFKEIDKYKALLLADYNYYLPEMMMYKVDRTSMANSLEVRSPFVDHSLIEYIMSCNTDYFEVGNPKNIIKNYLSTDFESSFTNRSKRGFVFDVESWVYNNLNLIDQTFKEGRVVINLNKNIIKLLSTRKTRINASRIWKLFVLENYISKI